MDPLDQTGYTKAPYMYSILNLWALQYSRTISNASIYCFENMLLP